jgi:hypothetical protein
MYLSSEITANETTNLDQTANLRQRRLKFEETTLQIRAADKHNHVPSSSQPKCPIKHRKLFHEYAVSKDRTLGDQTPAPRLRRDGRPQPRRRDGAVERQRGEQPTGHKR